MKKRTIVVVDYDPKWQAEFEALKAVLLTVLDGHILAIEHVGSTSIIGLKAKPIIDLDVIIDAKGQKLPYVIQQLATLGYQHVGDLGITGREAFKRTDEKTPKDGSAKTWMAHHLYVCPEGSIGLNNHLKFRDYLRAHPKTVEAYGALKQRLAKQFPHDIDAYVTGKSDFILEILQKTGVQQSTIKQIRKENE